MSRCCLLYSHSLSASMASSVPTHRHAVFLITQPSPLVRPASYKYLAKKTWTVRRTATPPTRRFQAVDAMEICSAAQWVSPATVVLNSLIEKQTQQDEFLPVPPSIGSQISIILSVSFQAIVCSHSSQWCNPNLMYLRRSYASFIVIYIPYLSAQASSVIRSIFQL